METIHITSWRVRRVGGSDREVEGLGQDESGGPQKAGPDVELRGHDLDRVPDVPEDPLFGRRLDQGAERSTASDGVAVQDEERRTEDLREVRESDRDVRRVIAQQ